MTDDETDELEHHEKRGTGERLDLIERDLRSHARSLTAIVTAGKAFTPEQMEQLRLMFREELSDAGLRIDGPDHIDDARRDFMFLRSLRKGLNGTAAKIGWAIIIAIIGAAVWLFTAGINAWRAGP